MSGESKTITIGIVDDHRLFRQGIRLMLSSKKFKILFEASSYDEANDNLLSCVPDVLLLDVEMPDKDGIEAAILLSDSFPHLKIIALSMHTAESFIFHMMKSGARSYLPKNADQKELQNAIIEVYNTGFHFTEMISKAMLRGVKENYKNKSPSNTTFDLSEREIEVLKLVCEGLTTTEIGEHLFISARTVEGHRKSILEKTGVTNSVSLAVFAVRNSLI